MLKSSFILLLSLSTFTNAAAIPRKDIFPITLQGTLELVEKEVTPTLNILKGIFLDGTHVIADGANKMTLSFEKSREELEWSSLPKAKISESPLCSDLDCLGIDQLCTSESQKDHPCWEVIEDESWIIKPTSQRVLKIT